MTNNICNGWQQSRRRICSPILAGWQRDLLQCERAMTNDGVISELDAQTVHHLLSTYGSPTKPFKPLTERFEIDYSGMVLPEGEGV